MDTFGSHKARVSPFDGMCDRVYRPLVHELFRLYSAPARINAQLLPRTIAGTV